MAAMGGGSFVAAIIRYAVSKALSDIDKLTDKVYKIDNNVTALSVKVDMIIKKVDKVKS